MGAGLCKSQRNSPACYETGEGILRTEHIKLKYLTLLPKASSMSREELSPELSVDSEDVENVASSFCA